MKLARLPDFAMQSKGHFVPTMFFFFFFFFLLHGSYLHGFFEFRCVAIVCTFLRVNGSKMKENSHRKHMARYEMTNAPTQFFSFFSISNHTQKNNGVFVELLRVLDRRKCLPKYSPHHDVVKRQRIEKIKDCVTKCLLT